ncbi:MAG: hypothetical protein ACFHVJ_08660 [Aestuariibacter sp.]
MNANKIANSQQSKYFKDVQSIDSIMKAYYEIVTGPAGEKRNIERDLYIHHSKAAMLFPFRSDDKAESFDVWTIQQFHQSQAQQEHVSEGFYEYEIGRQVKRFGNAAVVTSVYESRRTPAGEPFARGVNFVHLFYGKDRNGNNRWYVTSSSFDRESEDNPIPDSWISQ